MKIVLLSDFHLLWKNPRARLDQLQKTQFQKFIFILKYARDNDAIIIQAGDLCDEPRSWYLLPLVGKLLKRFEEVPFYCIYGQHDTYLYSKTTRDATTIGLLASVGLITVLDETPVVIKDKKRINLYGASYVTRPPLPRKTRGINILSIHDHITRKKLFTGHKYKNARRFLKTHENYDVIICGDIHQSFKVSLTNKITGKKRWILNTGPILRIEATKYNMNHHPQFYVYETDDNSIETVTIPHEPANDVLTRSHLVADVTEPERLSKLINNLKVDFDKPRVTFKDNLSYVIENHDIEGEVQDVLSEIMEERNK